MVRVLVDDVVRADEPLDTVPAFAVLEGFCEQLDASEPALLAVSEVGPLVVCPSDNPFFWAIHTAYSQHRPLVLTPDAFWLTIAQGLEQHIALNAERLRPLLVKHDGKVTLEQQVASLTLSGEQWADCVEVWGEQIADYASAEIVAWMACDFSTSGPVERVAGKIVLMSALRHFFDYYVKYICGIPEVELRGTVEDWERIRARIDLLDRYGLELWASRLRPICDALVQTARGEADVVFWQRMYLPHEVYGASLVVGWCADLFPYLKRGDGDTSATVPNRALEATLEERLEACREWVEGRQRYYNYAVTASEIPCAGSMAPIRRTFEDYEWEATLIGGVLGVRQDGLWLEPVACWMVREQSSTTTAVSKLAAQFSLTSSGSSPPYPEHCAYSQDLIEAFAYLGAGELYDGRWTLFDPADWSAASPDGSYRGTVFGGLSDGRSLVAIPLWKNPKFKCLYFVVQLTEQGLEDDPAVKRASSSVLVATSFEELILRWRASNGAFFMDRSGFTPPAELPPI